MKWLYYYIGREVRNKRNYLWSYNGKEVYFKNK